MKKKWLFVPVLAGMLVLAVVGGTAFAQSENGDEGSPWSSFAGRVASILGLDEATVQDAMDQAKQELQDEAVQAKLDSLVDPTTSNCVWARIDSETDPRDVGLPSLACPSASMSLCKLPVS